MYRYVKNSLTRNAFLRRLELKRIMAPSRRYAAILKAVIQEISLWSDIKRYVITVAGNINDARFNGLLEKLMKYEYVRRRITSI